MGTSLVDVVVDIDTLLEVPTADNSWGLCCRRLDNNNMYIFQIRNDGSYSIAAKIDGEWMSLADWA